MSGDSKKRNELKEQINRRIFTTKTENLEKVANYLNSPKSWNLEKVTTFPNDSNLEVQKFILCFDYFNRKACCFEQFNQAKGSKLLEILEKVAKCEVNKFSELKLVRDSVSNTREYESLFSTVSDDVKKIEETDLCDGRLFFFITEPMFNIISVETKHRNTDR